MAFTDGLFARAIQRIGLRRGEQSVDDAAQMIPHGIARGLAVVLAQRRENAPMFADARFYADAAGPLQHMHAKRGFITPIPKVFDDRGDRRVARGLRDGDVKAAIRYLPLLLARILLDHIVENGFDFLELLLGDDGRRQRRRLAFEQATRLGQLERADVEVIRADMRLRLIGDVDSRTLLRLDQAADLERNHRFADAGTADLEGGGEVALRGQPRAALVVARFNRRHDGVGHLTIEFAGISRSTHDANLDRFIHGWQCCQTTSWAND